MNASAPDDEAIFHAARDIPDGDRRQEYVRNACAGDAYLVAHVEALLAVADVPDRLLDRPAVGGPARTIVPPKAEGVGTVIGPYKLLEKIGEGGMGAVYMAEQVHPVRRKVALKVIKPGLDTAQVVARFEAERQALALMDHPNIAKVHDAGATEQGRPYFVMELVRGLPVTDYCDQARLPVRDRLALFVQVCRAVQHAHQRGVIHRDLKPSNVLVTVIDGRPVPKVIDFGVAKATGTSLTERTLATGFHQLIGTPLYMSPEQAELSGVDVDTRSDVYALGVLLYELLTGTTPFDAETLRKAPFDDVRRMIREEEPAIPSRRLSTLAAERQSTVSERRGVDGRRLGRLLRGELDWVVMRALEKDRSRRYESVSALAADVERYLADEPVEAGAPSAGYWLRKYVRRNRRLLAVAVLFAAVLISATAVSTWLAVEAREARHWAVTEAALARAVNDFLQKDLLGQVDGAAAPGRELGDDPYLTVKEALDRASAQIGQRFKDQPLVEAAIRATIGVAYRNLSEFPVAVSHLERTVVLRRIHLGPDNADTLASMNDLAIAYKWIGRVPDAIALFRQIIEARKVRFGPEHPDTLASEAGLANSYPFAGQWDVSARLVEEVLGRQVTVCGPAHPDTVGSMHNLAQCYSNVGRLDEAMVLHEKVLGLLESTVGPEHKTIHWPRLTYARACQEAGRLDLADHLLREALEQLRKWPDSISRRRATANTLGWLARNFVLQQRYAEAEPLAQDAIAFYAKHWPTEHRRFLLESVLGEALSGQQKYGEAEPLLLRGYEGMLRGRPGEITGCGRRLQLEAGERIVRFYERTGQPEKAREWRANLSPARPIDRGP